MSKVLIFAVLMLVLSMVEATVTCVRAQGDLRAKTCFDGYRCVNTGNGCQAKS